MLPPSQLLFATHGLPVTCPLSLCDIRGCNHPTFSSHRRTTAWSPAPALATPFLTCKSLSPKATKYPVLMNELGDARVCFPKFAKPTLAVFPSVFATRVSDQLPLAPEGRGTHSGQPSLFSEEKQDTCEGSRTVRREVHFTPAYPASTCGHRQSPLRVQAITSDLLIQQTLVGIQ